MKAFVAKTLCLLTAGLTAWLAGWYFKTPSARLLEDALRYKSKWRRDDYINIKRLEVDFFDDYYFDFNIFAFIICFIIIGGLLILIADKFIIKIINGFISVLRRLFQPVKSFFLILWKGDFFRNAAMLALIGSIAVLVFKFSASEKSVGEKEEKVIAKIPSIKIPDSEKRRNLLTNMIATYEKDVEITDEYIQGIEDKYKGNNSQMIRDVIKHYEPDAEINDAYITSILKHYKLGSTSFPAPDAKEEFASEKRKILHKFLVDENLYSKSLVEFETQFANQQSRRKLHQALSEKYEAADYATFNSTYFADMDNNHGEQRKKLFQVVSEKGLFSKDRASFEAKYKDPIERQFLYKVLKDEKLLTLGFGEFNEKYFGDIDLIRERRKHLYEGLKKDGDFTSDYETFQATFKDRENRQKLYKGLKKDGRFTRDYENFEAGYFGDLVTISPAK